MTTTTRRANYAVFFHFFYFFTSFTIASAKRKLQIGRRSFWVNGGAERGRRFVLLSFSVSCNLHNEILIFTLA